MIFRFLKILIFRIILPIQTKSVCLSVLTQFQFAFWIFLPLETFTFNYKTHWQTHTCLCIYVYASIYNKSNSILSHTHKHLSEWPITGPSAQSFMQTTELTDRLPSRQLGKRATAQLCMHTCMCVCMYMCVCVCYKWSQKSSFGKLYTFWSNSPAKEY